MNNKCILINVLSVRQFMWKDFFCTYLTLFHAGLKEIPASCVYLTHTGLFVAEGISFCCVTHMANI